MLLSLLYIVLALFGLGFLVFIHELGHYIMARRVGMRVETFAIGFGKPLITWEFQGVKWQFNMLPFGGYVRIAGMEKQGNLEPSQIPDGFFGKTPWQRIQVALAGPVTNILFAFVAFSAIWFLGGREKSFSEFSRIVGWVDPQSELYQADQIRPGDQITSYDSKKLDSFVDLVYSSILENKIEDLKGFKVDYEKQTKEPFAYPFDPAKQMKGGFNTFGPASFLIYHSPIDSSPFLQSGIQPGDRILAVDGVLIFSRPQLRYVINQPLAYLTVERGDRIFSTRIPRLKIADMRLNPAEKGELEDWQSELGMKGRISDLYYIPYNVSAEGKVVNSSTYIDERSEERIFHTLPREEAEIPLLAGDRILAVDGIPVKNARELFQTLQTRHVRVMIQREKAAPVWSWKEADTHFFDEVNWSDFNQLSAQVGSSILQQGDLVLLKPVVPITVNASSVSEEKKAERLKEINRIEDTQEKERQLKALQDEQNALMLGISLTDRTVRYNPPPTQLFSFVVAQTWKTLAGLFSGFVSPKAMQGPIGIVQVMQQSWAHGFKEALYWLGFISLNLAILNLLPIPILDGGHICMSVVESVTKKPLKAKTMEWIVIPFVVLLILFFVFVTYHDILRIFKGIFS